MFSLGGGEEDLDFTPSNGGGLKSLFGMSAGPSKAENLKFSAPKQPRPEVKAESSAGSGVLFATACQTYVYTNNNYAPKGKLGVAITGARSVIIYGQKQKILSNCKISPETVFTISAANFMTYYDDAQVCWGLMFSNDKDTETFCQKMVITKFQSSKSLVKYQANLVANQSRTVGETDTVVVSYTGNLMGDGDLGVEFDRGDAFTVRLGGGGSVIKGWVEALPGCSVGGVYLLAIPAFLAYGDKGVPNRIPPSSDLFFKITIREVVQSVAGTPAKSPSVLSNDLTDSSSVDSLPTPRKGTLNGVPQRDKTDILSRMARMGAQPALPTTAKLQPSPPRVPSSPEQPQEEARSRTSSVRSTRAKRHSTRTSSQASEPPQVPLKPGPLVPQYTSYHSAFAGYPPAQPAVINVPEIKENLELSRSVGKSVSSMETTLRDVQYKLDTLAQQAVIFNTTIASSPSVDTQLLMYNIQRIVAENETLKTDLKNKTVTLQERSAKITELLNKNQDLMNLKNEAVETSQNSYLANSSFASKEIQRLELENEGLKNELKVFKSCQDNRQFEIDAKHNQISALQSQIETLYTSSNSLQRSLFEAKNELSALKMSSLNSQEGILQNEIIKLKERLQSTLMDKLELSQQLDDAKFNEKQLVFKHDKKIKQLAAMLEEQQASDTHDSLVIDNTRLSEELESANSSVASLKEDKYELQQKLEELTLKTDQLTKRRTVTEEELQGTISALQEEVEQLGCKLQDQESRSSQPDPGDYKEIVSSKVKQILNTVFRDFKSQVEMEEEYEGREVLRLVMMVLKEATLSLIEESGESDEEPDTNSDQGDSDPGDSNHGDNDHGDDDDGDHGDSDHGDGDHGDGDAGTNVLVMNSTEFEIPDTQTDYFNEDAPTPTTNDSFYSTQTVGTEGEEDQQDPELDPHSSQHNPELESLAEPPEPQPAAAAGGSDSVEFAAREEEDLWMAAPPSSPPPSPAPATFEPNFQHTTVSVEDISHLSPEVFGEAPDVVTTSPSESRREGGAPPPLFSDSEDDLLDI